MLNWSIKNNEKVEIIYLNYNQIIFLKCLIKILPEFSNEFGYLKIHAKNKISFETILKLLKNIRISFFSYFKKLILLYLNQIQVHNIREVLLNPNLVVRYFFHTIKPNKIFKGKLKSVLVSFNEGMNFNYRNDLFWYNSSNVPPERIVIYFSEPNHLSKNNSFEENINIIENLKINWCSLILHNETKKNFIGYKSEFKNADLKVLYYALKTEKYNDEIGIWISEVCSKLLKNTNMWFNFFDDFNVGIHIDASESIVINEKSLALELIQGISISKERSFIVNHEVLLDWYPNDVFFSNSNITLENFKKTNSQKNVLTSGLSYPINKVALKYESAKIKSNFSKKLSLLYVF